MHTPKAQSNTSPFKLTYQDITSQHHLSCQVLPYPVKNTGQAVSEAFCHACGLETREFKNADNVIEAATILDWPHHQVMYFELHAGSLVNTGLQTLEPAALPTPVSNPILTAITAAIAATDTIVYHTARLYRQARSAALSPGNSPSRNMERSPRFIPKPLRRPLARATSVLARSILAVTDPACSAAWNLYNRATDYVCYRAARHTSP